jgi:hypothetical protein
MGMLFKQFLLDKIAAGQVMLAFRRWKRSTVMTGGPPKTSVGVLRIRSLGREFAGLRLDGPASSLQQIKDNDSR